MITELTFYIYKYIFANYNDCFHTLKNKPKSNLIKGERCNCLSSLFFFLKSIILVLYILKLFANYNDCFYTFEKKKSNIIKG